MKLSQKPKQVQSQILQSVTYIRVSSARTRTTRRGALTLCMGSNRRAFPPSFVCIAHLPNGPLAPPLPALTLLRLTAQTKD